MANKKIGTITIPITEEMVRNVVTNSMEGPVSVGWAEIVHRIAPTDAKKGEAFTSEERIMRGGAIILKDNEADDGKERILDLKKAKRGLQVMAEKEPRHFAALLSGDDDAETADVWLQCALLGKCVYG